MNNFLSVEDVSDPMILVKAAINLKKDPYADSAIGKNKVLGLIFFNPSLRTRMSTTRAALNLGMQVISMNVTQDSWQLETADGAIMDQGKAEHIKEAAAVMGSYCDMLGVRSFPTLTNREEDYSEELINAFVQYGSVPVINLESATLHPLQSFADLMTIEEHKRVEKPKIVMTWAPHIKSLPQSVANSFAQWMNAVDSDLTITCPKEVELSPDFAGKAVIEKDQDRALEGADFVYVKNWSSYNDYGRIYDDESWTVSIDKLKNTNNAKLMHCLPVRRNVVIADDAMDSPNSIIQNQAENRLFTAQQVLKTIINKL
ncbi:MAG: acetylornithine carbamoyltransferase [Cyclobacteriaceae bacterium]|nr:acetylornithine carbamoyltransferase [Cyclobacteriaceae bacterium HetDA_MAG_MS6]